MHSNANDEISAALSKSNAYRRRVVVLYKTAAGRCVGGRSNPYMYIRQSFGRSIEIMCISWCALNMEEWVKRVIVVYIYHNDDMYSCTVCTAREGKWYRKLVFYSSLILGLASASASFAISWGYDCITLRCSKGMATKVQCRLCWFLT